MSVHSHYYPTSVVFNFGIISAYLFKIPLDCLRAISKHDVPVKNDFVSIFFNYFSLIFKAILFYVPNPVSSPSPPPIAPHLSLPLTLPSIHSS